jgi:hypothetical protein
MSTEFISEGGLQITRYSVGPRGRLYSIDSSTTNMTEKSMEDLGIFIFQVLMKGDDENQKKSQG